MMSGILSTLGTDKETCGLGGKEIDVHAMNCSLSLKPEKTLVVTAYHTLYGN